MTNTTIDPRPSSPAQLAVAAVAIWILGTLIPVLHFLAPMGLILLLVAAAGYLMRPRKRSMFWRGRTIELDDGQSRVTTRLYRAVFKS
jgi:hypothetical protein